MQTDSQQLELSLKRKKATCCQCGATVMEYRHSFSESLARGLHALFTHGAPVNLKHLNLTRNQWDNFQKLRYWSLVEKYQENGRRVAGTWKITERGRKFVLGECTIPRTVWTYRGERTRYEGEEIAFDSVHDAYKQREDYAKEAQPHHV